MATGSGPSGDASPVLTVEGGRIDDIPTLYEEINRVFMGDESWALGHSLDALDDMLYGGYGATRGRDGVTIRWVDHAHTAAALGVEATRRYYDAKIRQPEVFDGDAARRRRAELLQGTGQTYFEMVREIFESHRRVVVRWE